MKNKENKSEATTPKKSISKLNKMQLSNKNDNDTTSIKDLLPPFLQNILNTLPSLTPLKKQPQYLLSPSPVKKDLFSQLLGSQRKNNSPYMAHTLNFNNMIMEQQDNDYMDDQSIKQNSQSQSQNSDSENDCMWQDQNGIKKRKRKSTVQIKMLKQQLDGQMNWTKQKIVKMAQVTGLSQSQVYKWCWDQKKKSIKNKDSHKRKQIRKQLAYRADLQERGQEYMQNHKLQKKNDLSHQYELLDIRTKPKVGAMIEQSIDEMNTEKKINKKLVFY